jgi:hypothetical protein
MKSKNRNNNWENKPETPPQNSLKIIKNMSNPCVKYTLPV